VAFPGEGKAAGVIVPVRILSVAGGTLRGEAWG